MLNSFKKPRKNASAAKQQKINVAKKLAARPASPPSSDTEADSDSDSEYEEILISSINGKPQKPSTRASLERTETGVQEPEPPSTEPNHANHFTEPTPSQTSVPAEPHAPHVPTKPAKPKRKKVVIKKYYQQRKVPEAERPPAAVIPEPAARMSYIGISSSGHRRKPSSNPHSTMSSRILNW